jgi:hypothetical protein
MILVNPRGKRCDWAWCERANKIVHVMTSRAVVMAGNHTGQTWGQGALKSENKQFIQRNIMIQRSMRRDKAMNQRNKRKLSKGT